MSVVDPEGGGPPPTLLKVVKKTAPVRGHKFRKLSCPLGQISGSATVEKTELTRLVWLTTKNIPNKYDQV